LLLKLGKKTSADECYARSAECTENAVTMSADHRVIQKIAVHVCPKLNTTLATHEMLQINYFVIF